MQVVTLCEPRRAPLLPCLAALRLIVCDVSVSSSTYLSLSILLFLSPFFSTSFSLVFISSSLSSPCFFPHFILASFLSSSSCLPPSLSPLRCPASLLLFHPPFLSIYPIPFLPHLPLFRSSSPFILSSVFLYLYLFLCPSPSFSFSFLPHPPLSLSLSLSLSFFLSSELLVHARLHCEKGNELGV